MRRHRKLQDGESLFDQREETAPISPHPAHVMDDASLEAFASTSDSGATAQNGRIVESYYRSLGPAGATDAEAAFHLKRLHGGTGKNTWSPARNALWKLFLVLKTRRRRRTLSEDGTSTGRTTSGVNVHIDHATPDEIAWARAKHDAEFGISQAAVNRAQLAWKALHAETPTSDRTAALEELVTALESNGLFSRVMPKFKAVAT